MILRSTKMVSVFSPEMLVMVHDCQLLCESKSLYSNDFVVVVASSEMIISSSTISLSSLS